jgi:hypothetical protein
VWEGKIKVANELTIKEQLLTCCVYTARQYAPHGAPKEMLDCS